MFEFLKIFLVAEKPAPPVPEPKHPVQSVDPDEVLLDSIKNYRERMFEAAESEFYSTQPDTEKDNQRIQRAERFLEESGLGRGTMERT